MIRAAIVVFLLSSGALWAQSDPAALARRAASALETAARAMTEADGSRDRIAALTRAVRAYEAGLDALREGVRQAAAQEAAIRADFGRDDARLGALLAVLQKMQSGPEAMVLLHPDGALGTARGGMILSDVTPALVAQVEALSEDLRVIAALRAVRKEAEGTLLQGLRDMQDARSALSVAAAARGDLPRRVTEDPDRMRDLANGARSLADFADSLSKLPADADAPPLPDFTAAKGDLELPVRGRVIAEFDAPDTGGVRRPGIVLATAPGALVTTPWPATIRYLGPLLDYGTVAILEPLTDHLLVLAGLDRVYGEIGQILPEGAPLGLMPGGSLPGILPIQESHDDEDGELAQETLYMELRVGDNPVDPARWFRMNED